MRHALLLIATIVTATACSDGPLTPDGDSSGLLPVKANYVTGLHGTDSGTAWLTPEDTVGVVIVERNMRENYAGGIRPVAWRFARGDDDDW